MFGRERTVETHLQHANLLAPAQQFIHHLFTGADGRTHDNDDAFCLRMAVILKRLVLTPGGGGKVGHRLVHMVIHRVIPRVGRLAGLEVGIRVSGGAADHRVLRVQRPGAVGIDLRLGKEVADRLIRERDNFIYLMGGAEAVEEVDKGHAAFQRRHV